MSWWYLYCLSFKEGSTDKNDSLIIKTRQAMGDSDFGDIVMLVTLRWRQFFVVGEWIYVVDGDQNVQKPSTTILSCHQHISSSTSITNIDVIQEIFCEFVEPWLIAIWKFLKIQMNSNINSIFWNTGCSTNKFVFLMHGVHGPLAG